MKNVTSIANRSISIDLLKVLSIFAVVFIHGSNLIPFSPSYSKFITPALRFCVPVFVFFWAFFTEKSIAKSNNSQSLLFRRFASLAIPFFFWSIIYFLITVETKNLTISNFFSKHWAGFGWSGQYYFLILFQFIPLFFFIRYLTKSFSEQLLVLLLASVLFYACISYSNLFDYAIVQKIGYKPFVYWIPYVVLGITMAKLDPIKTFKIPLIIVVLSPLLIPIELFCFNEGKLNSGPYLMPSVFITTCMLINASFSSNISISDLNPVVSKAVNTIASNTLGIFCLNPLIIFVINSVFNSNDYFLSFFGVSLLLPLFSSFLILGLCLFCIFVIKRIGFGILISN